MVMCLETNIARAFVGAGLIASIGLISFWTFVLSEFVICLLTFDLCDSASLLGFVLFVALVCSCVGAMIIGYVSLILFLSFVLSDSVLSVLTFEL